MSLWTHCLDEETEVQKAVTCLTSVGREGIIGSEVLAFLVQGPHLLGPGSPIMLVQGPPLPWSRVFLPSWSMAPIILAYDPPPSWSRAPTFLAHGPYLPGPWPPPSWSRATTFLVQGPHLPDQGLPTFLPPQPFLDLWFCRLGQ